MTSETSRRITALRFPLIVGVVYIHAVAFLFAPPGQAVGLASRIVRTVIADGVSRTAVPIFYLIAGFLFFRSLDNKALDLASYREKLTSRARTLLVPYLFWNTLALLIVVTASSLPGVRNYVDGANRVLSAELRQAPLSALFRAYGAAPTPVSYPFWFIRDLIVLVVASPLVYFGAKYARWPFLAALGSLWLLQPSFLAAQPLSIEAAFFFSLGASIALHGNALFPSVRAGGLFGIACATMLSVEIAFPAGLGDAFHRSMIVCGGLCVLGLSQAVLDSKRTEAILAALAPASFFVFATHEPLLTIFRKLTVRAANPGPMLGIALYLLVPILVVSICLGLYAVLSRIAPRLLSTVTGGR